ncbi:MAG: helix-turn-helix transcriptional regulator [Oscillospiraceae bacterium]|nr:helix-turn-helix transcriptional regulator [Oscillospiraceae bacterium]
MVNFGEKLRTLRKEAGMTQTELAKKLNITKSVVSYYELQERTPSPEVIVKLAAVFHVTADYLLGIENKKLIDVSDLTEDDMRFLLVTIETLRKKNHR